MSKRWFLKKRWNVEEIIETDTSRDQPSPSPDYDYVTKLLMEENRALRDKARRLKHKILDIAGKAEERGIEGWEVAIWLKAIEEL